MGGYGGQLQSLSFISDFPQEEVIFTDKRIKNINQKVLDALSSSCVRVIEEKDLPDENINVIPSVPYSEILKYKKVVSKLFDDRGSFNNKNNLFHLKHHKIPTFWVREFWDLDSLLVKFPELILKKIRGSGSKEIHIINKSNIMEFKHLDFTQYIAQQYIGGDELVIDICLYENVVEWTGRFSVEREFGRDMKIRKFEKSHSDFLQIETLIDKLTDIIYFPSLCFNIQTRKTENGWAIMEMDTRFSGSSSFNKCHSSMLNNFFENNKEGFFNKKANKKLIYNQFEFNEFSNNLCELLDIKKVELI